MSLRFSRSRGEAALTYELASDRPGDPAASRRLRGRLVNGTGELTYAIPARLRRSDRFEALTLVVANGNPAQRVTYRVVTS